MGKFPRGRGTSERTVCAAGRGAGMVFVLAAVLLQNSVCSVLNNYKQGIACTSQFNLLDEICLYLQV